MSKIEHDEHEPMPEGEEAAPPLTHGMSVVRWILFGGTCLFALIMVLGYFGMTPWAAGGEEAQQYHCPMHPTYISNQPGDCPICGMSLVPVGAKGTEAIPEMDNADYEWMRQTQAKQGQYGCPMDPEVVSDTAGRCPICRMFLVQVDTNKIASGDHEMSESNIPGLVSVTIEPERLQLIGLRTTRVARRTVDDPVRAVGFVTPDETRRAEIQVRTSGWVQDLFIDQTGQYVRKGEKLLSLYSPELYQAWQEYRIAREGEESASAGLIDLKRDLITAAEERLRLLGIASEDIQDWDAKTAEPAIVILRSPVSGHVLEKQVQVGQSVTTGQTLMAVADLSSVWIVAEVYESDAGQVHVGDSASVTTTGDANLMGKVSFIYPTISAATRTLKVRIASSNPTNSLRPGEYVEVAIHRPGVMTLAVPSEAILDGGETQYAFVVHNGTHFQPRQVSLGKRGDDWVEIVAGVSEGETVVTSANFLIDSESRLQAAIAGMGKSTGTHQH